ncbi:MAG: hydroxymethylbilane synthase [Marinilabiliales bacterium]|nr:hydroxymethylbilane synthase [Marinilabiliales bacterium]
MDRSVKIGTRGSQLALWQANVVKEELEDRFPDIEFEIVIIKTKGDKILDVPLSKIGDKGLFTKELEIAMFEGEIDMAVHSLKDLPTRFPEGVELGAVLKRGEVRDAVISLNGKKLSDLTAEDIIATSSLRRKAQLLRINSQFQIVEIRGNVNTRIRKMEEGYCTAMVIAGAGLQRLGMDRYITELIDPESVIPACSQGAIAIEIKEGDATIAQLVGSIDDRDTRLATDAERAFLRSLEGGCQIPVGSHTRLSDGTFEITGFISSIDGTEMIRESAAGSEEQATEIAISLANRLLDHGGREILQAIRLEDPFAPKAGAPLTGKVLISTRPIETGDTLPDLLRSQGATVVAFPMIAIHPADLSVAEMSRLDSLGSYDWLFFTSRQGVVHFFRALIERTGGSQLPTGIRLAVVGSGTAAELEYYGYSADFVASEHNSEAMAEEFLAHYIESFQLLLALGNLADDTLAQRLGNRHATSRITVYETRAVASADPGVVRRIEEGNYDLLLFTSPSTFHNFVTFVDTERCRELKMASIGKTTTHAIREAGFTPLLTASMSNAEGLKEAILRYYQQ